MTWTIIHIADLLLWTFMAGSVAYVFVFAMLSTLPGRGRAGGNAAPPPAAERENTFLILFPAYGEDSVIVRSVATFLRQDYPSEKFRVAVISDHMRDDTNESLAALPVTLLRPSFTASTKAKSLQHAADACGDGYDYAVILDADNIVRPDFLRLLNTACNRGYRAIQCHRCAKNSDNDIAVLDGISEEINNSIFRRGHNAVGLSSALIGSGMCFDYSWFRANVNRLSTAGEDKELEALLLRQRIFIKYEAGIHVFDEKVSSKDNFQKQRKRWMTAQVQSLLSMIPHLPAALAEGNADYIDKTVQQMLIPRSILIVAVTFFAVLTLAAVPVWSAKWWVLLAMLAIALLTAMPGELRSRKTLARTAAMPALVWKMLMNIKGIDRNDKTFTHTKHDK